VAALVLVGEGGDGAIEHLGGTEELAIAIESPDRSWARASVDARNLA
jgi:hypothetical protein